MMNADLLVTLMGLRVDPSLAVILYKQLFEGCYWVLVQKPVVNIEHYVVPYLSDTRQYP